MNLVFIQKEDQCSSGSPPCSPWQGLHPSKGGYIITLSTAVAAHLKSKDTPTHYVWPISSVHRLNTSHPLLSQHALCFFLLLPLFHTWNFIDKTHHLLATQLFNGTTQIVSTPNTIYGKPRLKKNTNKLILSKNIKWALYVF